MRKKEIIIGLVILACLILIIVGIKFFNDSHVVEDLKDLTEVKVAVGGGKEDFLADEEVAEIFKNRYKLNVVYD